MGRAGSQHQCKVSGVNESRPDLTAALPDTKSWRGGHLSSLCLTMKICLWLLVEYDPPSGILESAKQRPEPLEGYMALPKDLRIVVGDGQRPWPRRELSSNRRPIASRPVLVAGQK